MQKTKTKTKKTQKKKGGVLREGKFSFPLGRREIPTRCPECYPQVKQREEGTAGPRPGCGSPRRPGSPAAPALPGESEDKAWGPAGPGLRRPPPPVPSSPGERHPLPPPARGRVRAGPAGSGRGGRGMRPRSSRRARAARRSAPGPGVTWASGCAPGLPAGAGALPGSPDPAARGEGSFRQL